jgi:hypothetical protein
MSQRKKAHTGNAGLFIVGTAIYLGLLMLFAYQTWQFVDWLFPSDQVLMKLLTVLCFDVMALFWACVDMFYRFASKGARTLVRWAWGISFFLSLIASIFYLVIESMFRFRVELTQQTVNIGYGITIFALTLNILFLTFWLYQEWGARHPREDEYQEEDEPEVKMVPARMSPQMDIQAIVNHAVTQALQAQSTTGSSLPVTNAPMPVQSIQHLAPANDRGWNPLGFLFGNNRSNAPDQAPVQHPAPSQLPIDSNALLAAIQFLQTQQAALQQGQVSNAQPFSPTPEPVSQQFGVPEGYGPLAAAPEEASHNGHRQ